MPGGFVGDAEFQHFRLATLDHVDRVGDDRARSTHPPETEPRKLPSASITRCEPTGRGAEPQVSTTVASATPRPSRAQASASRRISSSLAIMITPLCRHCTQPTGRIGLGAPRAAASASHNASIERRLWIGRNSCTCGSMARMPEARAWKAS